MTYTIAVLLRCVVQPPLPLLEKNVQLPVSVLRNGDRTGAGPRTGGTWHVTPLPTWGIGTKYGPRGFASQWETCRKK